MVDPKILDTLSKHHFTKGLDGQHRSKLAERAEPFQASAGELLFTENMTAHAFYLIQSGHVEIGTRLDEKEGKAIQRVGPGEAVGWSWLLPPYRWEFGARAVEAVEGLSFDAVWLREMCEGDHDLGYHLLKHLLAVVSRRLAAPRLRQLSGER